MASSSIVYYTHKTLSDGSHPIVLRLIFDRTPKYITIANILEKDWDAANKLVRKSHSNYKSINNSIKTKDSLAFDLLMELERGNSTLTPEKIIEQLKGHKKSETFFDFFSEYVEEQLRKKQFYEASGLEGRGKNIWSFHYGKKFNEQFPDLQREDDKSIFRKIEEKDIRFSDITSSFLRNLDIYLKVDCGLSERSIFNHMNLIRTVYNRAIDSKRITKEDYPFSGKSGYRMSMPESQKIALEEKEVLAIEKIELKEKTNTWFHAKNAWIFSLCFGGMRIGDVLKTKWTDIQTEGLNYVMGKNNKPVDVPIVERAKRILSYYEKDREENMGYVFPELRKANLKDTRDINRKIKNATKIYNVWLKRVAKAADVNKSLNNHLARHTFGHLSGDKIPVQTLQLIYRHSDIRTTINYQRHWMNKQKVGEAVKAVMSF